MVNVIEDAKFCKQCNEFVPHHISAEVEECNRYHIKVIINAKCTVCETVHVTNRLGSDYGQPWCQE